MADNRVRVAATTGLDLADLTHCGDVGNIKDAQAPETLFRYVSFDALQAAIDPAARLLDAHDEDVANDRYVALTTRAHHRTHQFRRAIFGELVDVKAVVVAGHHDVVKERHIGVGKIKQRRALGELRKAFFVLFITAFRCCCGLGLFQRGFGFAHRDFGGRELGGFLLCLLALFGVRNRNAQVRRVIRVKEARRLAEAYNLAQVHDGLARVRETGGQTRAWIGGQLGKKQGHLIDFRLLIVFDIANELE